LSNAPAESKLAATIETRYPLQTDYNATFTKSTANGSRQVDATACCAATGHQKTVTFYHKALV